MSKSWSIRFITIIILYYYCNSLCSFCQQLCQTFYHQLCLTIIYIIVRISKYNFKTSQFQFIFSRWSLIAGRVPGRTDNQVKNHWNTHLSKKLAVKQKKSRVCASSPTLSKESGESLSVPSKSNSRPPPNCNGGAVGVEVTGSGPLSVMDFYSAQEQQLWSSDEFDHNSFWLSINDDLNLQVPNLMELALDFVWLDL